MYHEDKIYVKVSDKIHSSGQPLPEEFGTIAESCAVALINLALHDFDGAIENEEARFIKHSIWRIRNL